MVGKMVLEQEEDLTERRFLKKEKQAKLPAAYNSK